MENFENLFLIGNGFDLWQGLPTSYHDFGKYYEKNKNRIAKELNIKDIIVSGKDKKISLNYFEFIYWFLSCEIIGADGFTEFVNRQNSLDLPQTPIPAEFWNDFEDCLFYLDTDYVLDGFRNKNKIDLKLMEKDFEDLIILLTEYLYQWINSVKITGKKSAYDFKNSFFINFNYTNTLRKRFGVANNLDYHIHGFANNKSTLCFGHTHKIEDLETHYEWEAIEIVKNYLQIVNKNPKQKIKNLKKYLQNNNLCLNNVKNIYVLGHSFGGVDFEYFKFFANTLPNAKWNISYHSPKDIVNIRKTLLKLGVTNYCLNKNIEKLIEPFRLQ